MKFYWNFKQILLKFNHSKEASFLSEVCPTMFWQVLEVIIGQMYDFGFGKTWGNWSWHLCYVCLSVLFIKEFQTNFKQISNKFQTKQKSLYFSFLTKVNVSISLYKFYKAEMTSRIKIHIKIIFLDQLPLIFYCDIIKWTKTQNMQISTSTNRLEL